MTSTNVESIIVTFINIQKSFARFKKFLTKSQTSKNFKNSQRKNKAFENETINFETQIQNIARKKSDENDKSQSTFAILLKKN